MRLPSVFAVEHACLLKQRGLGLVREVEAQVARWARTHTLSGVSSSLHLEQSLLLLRDAPSTQQMSLDFALLQLRARVDAVRKHQACPSASVTKHHAARTY